MKVVAVVGADLLTQSRIREAADRVGAAVTVSREPPLPVADLVIVDLETVAPEVLGDIGATRVVGIYPHVATEIADLARAAGIEPIPRSRFFRDLTAIVAAGVGAE